MRCTFLARAACAVEACFRPLHVALHGTTSHATRFDALASRRQSIVLQQIVVLCQCRSLDHCQMDSAAMRSGASIGTHRKLAQIIERRLQLCVKLSTCSLIQLEICRRVQSPQPFCCSVCRIWEALMPVHDRRKVRIQRAGARAKDSQSALPDLFCVRVYTLPLLWTQAGLSIHASGQDRTACSAPSSGACQRPST